MLEIITILLIIILSQVIGFTVFIVSGLIMMIFTGIITGLIMVITELAERIANKLKK